MPPGSLSRQSSASQTALAERFCQTRALMTALIAPLAAEDCVVQSMPDASPAKWHLAHTTWFFEQFVLGPHVPGYRDFDARFGYLFNSYYETVGDRHRRADRGLLTRPTLEQVRAYREHVDESVSDLLASGAHPDVAALIELGLHHEQQHQELLLTDLKHLLSCNPLRPAYRELEASEPADEVEPLRLLSVSRRHLRDRPFGLRVLFRQRDTAAPGFSRAIRSRASADQQCGVS